jgi:sugar phosphate isomerase/epimerase
MAQAVELMSLFWTTAGVFPGRGDVSPYSFRERVEAAARAGFTGIGLWHTDLEHLLQRQTLQELKAILDDNGMRHLELEFLTDWFVGGPKRAESDRRRRMLLEASAALHAKHIKVGDFERTPCPMPKLVEEFAALCREAQDYGATIGFEFMGSAVIDNLPDALTLVETAGAANGGLALDIVHVQTLRISHEALSRIPLRYLVSVELNDGALPGSPLHDPSRARRFCGEGDFDIRGFIATLTALGYRGPWAVEVMSEELVGLPLDELSARAFRSTMAQFAPAAP